MIFRDFEDHSGLAGVLYFPKLSNILKNHDLPKFIKGYFQNVIFNENERANQCV